MWKRWALVSCFMVLAMTSIVLFTYESTSVSGFQRINLTRRSSWNADRLEGTLEMPLEENVVTATTTLDKENVQVSAFLEKEEAVESVETSPEVNSAEMEKAKETVEASPSNMDDLAMVKMRENQEPELPEAIKTNAEDETSPDEPSPVDDTQHETSPDEPSPVDDTQHEETSPDEPSPVDDTQHETSPDETWPGDEYEEETPPNKTTPEDKDEASAKTISASVEDEEKEDEYEDEEEEEGYEDEEEENEYEDEEEEDDTLFANANEGDEENSNGQTRKGKEPFLGAGVRGFVVKRGMVPPHYFSWWTFEERKKSFERWLNAYKNGNLVSHAPMPFPHCQVYINHEYKFIWIKGHKVGSTSMRKPLGQLCDDRWKVAKDANFDHCSHGVFNNQSLTVKDMKMWWKQYFVFAFVRNPYTRFASAEEYIGGMIPKGCGRPTFEQTCREPYIHTRLCKIRQCCWKGSVSHHYRHFMDQSSCLFTDMLTPAVDFIGEVENIHEDFQAIIDEINRRRDKSLPELKNDLRKTNSHGRRLQQQKSYAYRLFQSHKFCLKTIAQFYNKDFMLLDYEKLSDFER